MKRIFVSALVMLGMFGFAFGQDGGNERSADRTLRGSGRVNASTLGMEFDLPLGSYPGRGINVPINLSYSSKVWRLRYDGHMNAPGASWSDCFAHYSAQYSENSASGWTTSLAAPYVEYVGMETLYEGTGLPYTDFSVGCPNYQTGSEPQPPLFYVRRILVHLPGGETHELRPDDTILEGSRISGDPAGPFNASIWNATYYAADGSNIKYVQNSTANTYRIQMPDGSFYDLDPTSPLGARRTAQKFTDRNGNFTSYYGPGSVDSTGATHPNGYWKDTLGRNIPIPGKPASATTAGNPQIYAIPGMNAPYKLHWKQLNGGTQAESAMTDISSPNYQLKYPGDTYGCSPSGIPTYCTRPTQETLFEASGTDVILAPFLFNPVVLTEIELPTGQKYKFTYDNLGRIEQIQYPTGGIEKLTYSAVPTLSTLEPNSSAGQTNFGVTNRRVYESASDQTPYEWNYAAAYVNPGGYKVTINNPDGTRSERFLHRGFDPCVLNPPCANGTEFGYDKPTAGMAYEEVGYDDANRMVSKKLTEWQPSNLTVSLFISGTTQFVGNYAGWHPRVVQEESRIYDTSANGISATSTLEYEGDLSLRDTPVLTKKSSQYAFVPVGSSLPSNPVKVSESTFLINDPNYAGVKSYYTAQNMVGIVTASEIRDGAGTVVSRSEMVYDDVANYPLSTPTTPSNWSAPSNGYRGNPNTSRVWDSTKGAVTNSGAYISTHAQFDNYGNQFKVWDAKGIATITAFDSTHQAFPLSVTSAVPDPTGTHGSNDAFTTTATFDFVTGLPLTTIDANGIETRITYDFDTMRPLNSKIYFNNVQVGNTSETIYNDEPNNYWVKNRSQLDENKWVESITYLDGLGRTWKSEQVDSGGNIFTEKEFDADGRVSRVTNPFRANETKVWTTNVYDEASRVKEVILPDGAKVKTDYGVSVNAPIGVTKQITDQAGKKRKGITNVLDQMVRVIEDPAGQNLNTDYIFDTLGNLRKTIQGEQNRYFYHDSLGRLLRAKQPEQNVNTALALPTADPVTNHNQWSVGYTYDDNGNILTTTDAKNKTVSATYDNFNRLKVRDYSDLEMPDVSFYYDGKYIALIDGIDVPQTATGSVKGKTTGIKSSVSRTNYKSFDVLGRLLTHEQVTDGQAYPTTYTYNLSGALIEETYPSGRVVKNTLGVDGELLQVQSKKNANYGFHTYAGSFAYDSAGAVTKMQLGNGRWETASYNNRLQITQIGLGTTNTDQNLLKLEYDYKTQGITDNNGSLRKQTITVPNVGQTNGFIATQTYLYDDLNRIQSAEEKVSGNTTWKQTFSIDRYGNRKFDAANTTTLGSCSTAICNPTANTSDNRFTTQDGYEYDANGNVIEDAQNQRFGYDDENHQTAFFDASNSGSTPDATYSYDGEGKRVKKISNTETTIFVYNAGGTLVAEYSTELALTQQVSYLTADHLGSPRVVSNENGVVTDRKDYSAFGEETMSSQRSSHAEYSGADELRKGYTGYEKDGESGLEFAQARYYNASHGRYTSVDPLTASASIKNPQTFNRYSYVLNSPYKYTDPLGLISVNTIACGACGNEEFYADSTGWQDSDRNIDWTKQQTAPPPPPPASSDDGTVDAKKITPTVTYTENMAGDDNVVFGPELRKALETIARTAEQLRLAYLQNADTALKHSKEFVDALDNADSWEILDAADLFFERNYGTVTKSGYVVLPSSVSSGTVGVNGGVEAGWVGGPEGVGNVGLSGTSGSSTFENIASKSANKANDQLRELERMNGATSVERQAFVNSFGGRPGTVATYSRAGMDQGRYSITKERADIFFSNAIYLGVIAANNRHTNRR